MDIQKKPNEIKRTEIPVSAIVLNWNDYLSTIAAVDSLLQQSVLPRTIYVVDNGSRDASVAHLKKRFKENSRVTLLEIRENLGFGGGCNRALNMALGDGSEFAWLVNNDATPSSNCLEALLDIGVRDPGVGVVGSWIHDPSDPRHDHSGSWVSPWLLSTRLVVKDEDLEKNQFSWITAASALLRVEALRHTGLFDERYFMYWEDADLCMRIRNNGFSLKVAYDAHVTHTAGTSSAQIPVQRYKWHFESQRLWVTTYHRWPIIARLVITVRFLLKAVLDRDWRRLKEITKMLIKRT